MSTKPSPIPPKDTEWFWNRCNDEELVVLECDACESRRLLPSDSCTECWHEESNIIVCQGGGTIESYTVMHYPHSQPFEGDVPYVIAIIEVDEGVRFMSNLVECEPNTVNIGDKVEIVWEQRDDQTIYQFKPV